MAENTYISRDMAGRIYRASLIKRGITDARLLDGMTEDFLVTQYDTEGAKGIKAYPSSGSSAYNFNNTKATPAPPPISGMGMPTASSEPEYNPLARGSANTGEPFFNPLGGGSANTGLPPASASGTPGVSIDSVPTPNGRPQAPMGGFDPLSQTSGHQDIVSRSGPESMNPAQAALLERLMAARRMV